MRGDISKLGWEGEEQQVDKGENERRKKVN